MTTQRAPQPVPPFRAGHVTLVIPTLDEVEAVAGLAALAKEARAAGVVDRVVVFDGGSTDGTIAAARVAGLEVIEAANLPPGVPVLGKGDSIWRAATLVTDVLVFRDADVSGVGVEAIGDLVAAVRQPGIALAKGSFERLQFRDGPPRLTSGRITEFVARPLLALLAPFVILDEPLSGQFAIRAAVLRQLEVVTRFGVDVGLVLDVIARHGAESVTEVDVGSLAHRSKGDASLVPMAHDVAATILGRTGRTISTQAGDGPWVAGRLACAGPHGALVIRPPHDPGDGPPGARDNLTVSLPVPSSMGRS